MLQDACGRGGDAGNQTAAVAAPQKPTFPTAGRSRRPGTRLDRCGRRSRPYRTRSVLAIVRAVLIGWQKSGSARSRRRKGRRCGVGHYDDWPLRFPSRGPPESPGWRAALVRSARPVFAPPWLVTTVIAVASPVTVTEAEASIRCRLHCPRPSGMADRQLRRVTERRCLRLEAPLSWMDGKTRQRRRSRQPPV